MIFIWAYETRIQVKSVFMNRTPLPGMNKDSYWVGLSRNKDGGMEWTDGSVVVSNSSACLTIFNLNFLDLCQLGTRRTIGNMEWRS